MSSWNDRKAIHGLLEFLEASPDDPFASEARSKIIEILRNSRPDHALGKVIATSLDADTICAAAYMYGTSLFRGASADDLLRPQQHGVFEMIRWKSLNRVPRVLIFSSLYQVFHNNRYKSIASMVAQAVEIDDADLLDMVFDFDKRSVRIALHQMIDRRIVSKSHALRKAVQDILNTGQADDLDLQTRTRFFYRHVRQGNSLAALALLWNGPIGAPEDSQKRIMHLGQPSGLKTRILKRLDTAHGVIQLISDKPPLARILAPGFEDLLQ